MRAIFRKLAQDVPAMLGLGIVLFVLLLALFGPWLAPYPEDASSWARAGRSASRSPW